MSDFLCKQLFHKSSTRAAISIIKVKIRNSREALNKITSSKDRTKILVNILRIISNKTSGRGIQTIAIPTATTIEVVSIIECKADGLSQVCIYKIIVFCFILIIRILFALILGGTNRSNESYRNNYGQSLGENNGAGSKRGTYHGQQQNRGEGYNRGHSSYSRGGRR